MDVVKNLVDYRDRGSLAVGFGLGGGMRRGNFRDGGVDAAILSFGSLEDAHLARLRQGDGEGSAGQCAVGSGQAVQSG